MNAERLLIAAECIGDAKWFIEKASAYAKERVLFNRPIGQNQGVQFPIARAYAQMRAAELMVSEGLRKYEAGEPVGEEAGHGSRYSRGLRLHRGEIGTRAVYVLLQCLAPNMRRVDWRHRVDFAQQQRNPGRHLIGFGIVVALHVLLGWALVTGLAQRMIEVIKAPIETKIIEEVKPPEPPPPENLPPPPKFAPPPPSFVPPIWSSSTS